MKEHLRYEKELAPIRFNQALALGKAVHKGIETRSVEAALATYDAFQPDDQDDQDRLEVAMATTEAALEGYFERYPAFEGCVPELQFELPMIMPDGRRSRKYKLAGVIDGIATIDGKRWIVEYKTAGKLDGGYFERLYVDGQITLYMYAARRLGFEPVGVIYRVIRKPQLRRKQGESVMQFAARLTEDYKARPDFYFMEEKLYRSSADLDKFERELWVQVDQAEKQRKKGEHMRHTCNCAVYGTCEYLPICSGQAGWEALYTTKRAHEELEGEE